MEFEIVKISEQIEKNLGLHYPENRFADLKQIIMSALTDLGYGNNFDNFYKAISTDSFTPLQYDILALHLTVGETYFFRESVSLQAIKNEILPPLIQERSLGKRSLRIWSAGCCTGEEAYTMAILLYELLPDIETWDITIIGTDINRNFIQKAIRGLYTQWSFRTTPIEMLNRYFKKVGKEFEVIPEIKKMVSFSYLNLIDDKYPSELTNTHEMDLILCRNVLMYFSDEHRAKVIHRFTDALIHHGWFITSPVEVSNTVIPHLTRVMLGEAILYCKDYSSDKRVVVDVPPLENFKNFHQVIKEEEAYYIPPVASKKQRVIHNGVLKDIVATQDVKAHKALVSEHFRHGKSDFQKAEASFRQGLYNDALSSFMKAHKQNVNDLKILYYLAKTNANLGYNEEALLWAGKLIEAETMNPNYHYLLATILFELNRDDEAQSALKKVLYLDSQYVLAHFVMGNYCRMLGKTAIARKHYQNITQILYDLDDNWIIPESDGITVARMKEMVALFR